MLLALCALGTFVLFSAFGDYLIQPDSLVVIVVSLFFFAFMAIVAGYSREHVDQSKWLTFAIWWGLLVSEEVFSYRSALTKVSGAEFASEAYAQAILWVIALGALIIVLLKHPHDLQGMFQGDYKWVTWLTVVSIVSCVFSPNIAFSLAWAFKLGLVVLLVHLCTRQLADVKSIRAFLGTTIGALIVLTVIPTIRSLIEPDPLADPTGELQQRFHEGPTAISGLAGLMLILCLTLYSSSRRKYLLWIAALGFVLMVMAGGKAGIAAGFVSGMLFYALQKRFKAAVGFVAILALAFALALEFTPLSQYFANYMKLEQFSSFTGRTDLWAFVMPFILQKPILGHGFNASRFVAVIHPETPFSSSHMHNSLVEVLYNNGLVGLVLLLMVLFVMGRNLWRTIEKSASPELRFLAVGCFASLINLFINGMFNATFGGRPDASYMILIALVIISTQLWRLSQVQVLAPIHVQHRIDIFDHSPALAP